MNTKLSHAVSTALFPKILEGAPSWMRELPEVVSTPGIWIERVIDGVRARITARKGVRKIFGSTDRYKDLHKYQRQRDLDNRSKRNQFPSDVLLEDGRNRYYRKYGMTVDRLAAQ